MKAIPDVNIRHKNQLLFFGKLVLISAAIGFAIAALRSEGQIRLITLIQGAICGTLIGVGCTATDLVTRSARRGSMLHSFPPGVLLAFRVAAFCLWIVLGLCLPIWLISGDRIWLHSSFGTLFLISALIATIMVFSIDVLRLLGTEVTVSLLTGRYRRARLEDRVVLFADLVGSTSLAEKIGDLGFHKFLGDVALDLAPAIERAHGEVHRYVGDAVIVTWRLTQKNACDASLNCAFEMHQALEETDQKYQRDFGATPKLRIAIHCGTLAAGEIGAWKKEVALLGDTMNTTARIEAAAREAGAKTAVSGDIARKLSAHARSTLTALPGLAANGKSEKLSLWVAK